MGVSGGQQGRPGRAGQKEGGGTAGKRRLSEEQKGRDLRPLGAVLLRGLRAGLGAVGGRLCPLEGVQRSPESPGRPLQGGVPPRVHLLRV